MKILVFGATGQVARSLQDLAQTEDVSVTCLGRPEGDIANAEGVERAIVTHGPDIVVNAAAYTAVDAAETDSDAAFAVNETGPANLAASCKAHNLPLIHYSTDYVFDGTKDGAYSPDDPVEPLGVYGRSKEAGERAIRETLAQHVILRTAWVFSPYGKNFVKTMLTLAKSRDELTVVFDQTGNPTYAPDIAAHTLTIARNIMRAPQNTELYGTFHLTNADATNWCEFANEIFRQANDMYGVSCVAKPIPASDYPTPAKRPENSRLDGASLRHIHGIEPRPWKLALKDCLQALSTEI